MSDCVDARVGEHFAEKHVRNNNRGSLEKTKKILCFCVASTDHCRLRVCTMRSALHRVFHPFFSL